VKELIFSREKLKTGDGNTLNYTTFTVYSVLCTNVNLAGISFTVGGLSRTNALCFTQKRRRIMMNVIQRFSSWTYDYLIVDDDHDLIMVIYKDGQQVFHYWWYFSSILLFVSLARLTSHEFLLEVMLWWMSLTMAIYAFLIFVLGSVWLVKDRSLHYPLFITFNCCILYLIYYYTQQNVGLSLVVAQWYLLGLYALIRRIMQWKEQPHLTYDDSNDLFKHILSWQTITRFKKKITGGPVELINDIQWFLDSIPSKRKSIFGLFNILLVVGQIGLFVFRMKQWIVSLDQLWFWLWIGFFFMSFILLRSIWFAYKLQRIMAFIVINVALYLSIIALFGNNVVYIVWSWIIWTIVNSLLIFHHKTFDRRWVLDYPSLSWNPSILNSL